MTTETTPTQDKLALAARIFIAVLFILAGVNKITDPAGTIGYIKSVGLPLAEVAYAGTVALEVLGGIALLIGFKTRLVAQLLAAFCFASAILFHRDFADSTQMVMFLKNFAIGGGLLQIAAFGPGKLSLDKG